jgi:hypothetical protein
MRLATFLGVALVAALAAGQETAPAFTLPPSPYNCTVADRALLNAAGLPYCIRVGMVKHNISEHEYYSHELPFKVWEASLALVEAADPNVTVTYVQSDYDYKQGLVAVENGEFDVFIADTWILQNRLQHVDFSAAYKIESLWLVYEKPAVTGGGGGVFDFFTPFQWPLWLAIAAMFLVGTIALALAELAGEESKAPAKGAVADRNDILGTIERAFFNCLQSPHGTQEALPRTAPGRLVMWGVSFFFMIIMASYTANLASFLTVAASQPVIGKAELLKSPVMVGPGDSDVLFEAHGARVIKVGVRDATPYGLSQNLLSAKSIGDAEHEAYIMTDANPNCSMARVQVDMVVEAAIAFRQHSPVTSLKRIVDQAVLGLKENGKLRAWDEEGRPNATCSDVAVPSGQMVFADVAGVFYLSFGVYGLMMLWALAWFVVNRIKGEPLFAAPLDYSSADTAPDTTHNNYIQEDAEA